MKQPSPGVGEIAPPVVPDVGVLGVVPDFWGDVWMPRHQVLTRLARWFSVVWMDPPREWREAWRGVDHPGGAPGSPTATLHEDPTDVPGFRIVRPGRRHPLVYRPSWAAARLERARYARAVRVLRRMGARRLVLHLWRPEYASALDHVPDALSCYHVDDEYSFSSVERSQDPLEVGLLRRADRVIVHSPGLWEKKAGLARHPFLVPNGVDFRAYATPRTEPPELAGIPHPRIGYVGVVKRFLDVPLLVDLARRHPDWSFVFVGPVKAMEEYEGAFATLRALPNTHFLGAFPVAALPGFVQHVDAAIMPYDVNDYTRYIYPLKLHEYLATGVPVVATPIRTLQDFGSVVSLASGADAWSAALSGALVPAADSAERIARRREVAAQHDWNRVAHRVATIFAEALGPDVAEAVAATGPSPLG